MQSRKSLSSEQRLSRRCKMGSATFAISIHILVLCYFLPVEILMMGMRNTTCQVCIGVRVQEDSVWSTCHQISCLAFLLRYHSVIDTSSQVILNPALRNRIISHVLQMRKSKLEEMVSVTQ